MRTGFIGAGGIAGNYRASLGKLNAPVAAVCDTNAERAEKVAEEENAKSYTDHTEMLRAEELDAVFICIPPGAHTTQVADCANAGCAVFVAKPIALGLDTARDALRAITVAGVINQVGYMARYSDLTAKVKELTADRQLGMGVGRFMCRMGAGHPWWGKAAVCGGQMLEQSTHVFDLLRFLLGDVAHVQAWGHRGLANDVADFEQCTVCNLRFANGGIGTVTSTCAASVPDGFALELLGRDFYLKLVLDNQLRGTVDGKSVEFEGTERGYFRQVERVVQAVAKHDQSLVRSCYADAAKTLATTLAANRSLVTGKVEKVEEV